MDGGDDAAMPEEWLDDAAMPEEWFDDALEGEESPPPNDDLDEADLPAAAAAEAAFTTQVDGEGFQSRQELLNFAQTRARYSGFAVSITSSKHDRVFLACSRGGSYRNRLGLSENQRRRRTGSKKDGCGFTLRGQLVNRLWRLTTTNDTHNHPPARSQDADPRHRRIPEAGRRTVAEMTNSGVRPAAILSTLRRSFPNSLVTDREVYNKRRRIRDEQIGGRTPVQALLDDLLELGHFARFETDANNAITHLLFTTSQSVNLAAQFGSVLFMDCTYKSNRYGMPLLDIVGATNNNDTFFVAGVFLRSETAEDYLWAMRALSQLINFQPRVIVTDRELALINALELIWPNARLFLCRWHINKNVLANCKQLFPNNDHWEAFYAAWHDIVQARTPDVYTQRWEAFQATYAHLNPTLRYLHNTWLQYKERFVAAWTDNVRHYNATVTSRVEGAHHMLKDYIGSSTGDVHRVVHRMLDAIANQASRISTKLGRDGQRHMHMPNAAFWQQVYSFMIQFSMISYAQNRFRLASPSSPSSRCVTSTPRYSAPTSCARSSPLALGTTAMYLAFLAHTRSLCGCVRAASCRWPTSTLTGT